jgi:16S rRNA C1402 (ribose-2'-O) methylase RsmI
MKIYKSKHDSKLCKLVQQAFDAGTEMKACVASDQSDLSECISDVLKCKSITFAFHEDNDEEGWYLVFSGSPEENCKILEKELEEAKAEQVRASKQTKKNKEKRERRLYEKLPKEV